MYRALSLVDVGASRQALLFVLFFFTVGMGARGHRWTRWRWTAALLVAQFALCALVYDAHIGAGGVRTRDLTTLYRYVTIGSGMKPVDDESGSAGTVAGGNDDTVEKDTAEFSYRYYARRPLREVLSSPGGSANCTVYASGDDGKGVFGRRRRRQMGDAVVYYEVCGSGGSGTVATLRAFAVAPDGQREPERLVSSYAIALVHTVYSLLGVLLAAAVRPRTADCRCKWRRRCVHGRSTAALVAVAALVLGCAFSGVDEYIAETGFPLGIARTFVVFVAAGAVAYCCARPSGDDDDYDACFLLWFGVCTLLIGVHLWLPVHAFVYTGVCCVVATCGFYAAGLLMPMAATAAVAVRGQSDLGPGCDEWQRRAAHACARVEHALFVGGKVERTLPAALVGASAKVE